MVPENLEIRQVCRSIFRAHGHILLFEASGQINLPDGKPANNESNEATLILERDFQAHVRYSALFRHEFPSLLDPITQRKYQGLWVPPTPANKLLKWGESGHE